MTLKIGILGHGHLGKIHRKCIEEIDNLELAAIYDPDPEVMALIPKALRCDSAEKLIERVDLVDIVAPTSLHARLATPALLQGKHVFIEKPVTATLREAQELVRLQESSGSVVQVGHVERFNPALLGVKHMKLQPRFLEVHRLAQFNPRGTDVSVVLDLMIHDLDILLALVSSQIRQVQANGVAIVSQRADIANARIEWENGTVANVTASRISLKQMRKLRIFQPDAYIALDFLEKSTQVMELLDENDMREASLELSTTAGMRRIHVSMPETTPVNAIKMELEHFRDCVLQGRPPEVGLPEALAALDLAFQIENQIQHEAGRV